MMAAAFEKKEKEILAKQETYYTAKEMEISNNHFTDQLLQQQKELIELHAAIEQQQSRLIQNCEAKKEHDIESLCTQDILRDRIKDIEKTYIELKCNFMRYFSTML
jgi:energy-converting hydrogenase A subunit M